MAPKRKAVESGNGASGEKAHKVKLADGGTPIYAMHEGGHGLISGCRIPKDYFMAKGWGDTNEGGGADPWETGSYDLALEMAGIQDFNVVPYTSVIPAEATEITFENAKASFQHGAVIEPIISVMHGSNGDQITAGVGCIKVRRKKDGKVHGGYAAEYKGHANEEGCKRILQEDLKGIFARRFGEDEYEPIEEKFIIQRLLDYCSMELT